MLLSDGLCPRCKDAALPDGDLCHSCRREQRLRSRRLRLLCWQIEVARLADDPRATAEVFSHGKLDVGGA